MCLTDLAEMKAAPHHWRWREIGANLDRIWFEFLHDQPLNLSIVHVDMMT